MVKVFTSDISISRIFDMMNYRSNFLDNNCLERKNSFGKHFKFKFLKNPMYGDNSGNFTCFLNNCPNGCPEGPSLSESTSFHFTFLFISWFLLTHLQIWKFHFALFSRDKVNGIFSIPKLYISPAVWIFFSIGCSSSLSSGEFNYSRQCNSLCVFKKSKNLIFHFLSYFCDQWIFLI